MSMIIMHVAGPKFKSVFSFCFFSALRRGWVCRHLALGLVQNRRVVRSRVFAASLRRHSALGLVSRSRASLHTRDHTTHRFCTSPSARCRRTHPQRSAEKKQKENPLLNLVGPATCIMITDMRNHYDYIKAPIKPLM